MAVRGRPNRRQPKGDPTSEGGWPRRGPQQAGPLGAGQSPLTLMWVCHGHCTDQGPSQAPQVRKGSSWKLLCPSDSSWTHGEGPGLQGVASTLFCEGEPRWTGQEWRRRAAGLVMAAVGRSPQHAGSERVRGVISKPLRVQAHGSGGSVFRKQWRWAELPGKPGQVWTRLLGSREEIPGQWEGGAEWGMQETSRKNRTWALCMQTREGMKENAEENFKEAKWLPSVSHMPGTTEHPKVWESLIPQNNPVPTTCARYR